MPDWKTRLAVSYQDETGTHLISPLDSYSPSFALNAEVLHSVEATHMGIIYSPQAMSFSITVRAIGDTAAQLTALALEGKRFDIILQEAEGGADWSFRKIVMSQCVITSAAPTTATVSGAPSATFSGVSLAASAEATAGPVKIP
jgi:hypothetical protein